MIILYSVFWGALFMAACISAIPAVYAMVMGTLFGVVIAVETCERNANGAGAALKKEGGDNG